MDWRHILDFIFNAIQSIGKLGSFLNSTLREQLNPTTIRVLEFQRGLTQLGLGNLTPIWILDVTPLQMLTGSLIGTLTVVFIVTVIKKFWPLS